MGKRKRLYRLAFCAGLLLQLGCTAFLPSARDIVESPWHSYAEAKGAFDRIVVDKTTIEDLKGLGFDVATTPNVKVLSYLDVAAMVQPIPIADLDPGLQTCLRARENCRAFIFEPQRTYTKRIGSFWLDVLNFRRRSHETGWRFKALIVFVDHHVAYKLSSGDPQINHFRDQRNPLGPLQDPAGLVYRAIP